MSRSLLNIISGGQTFPSLRIYRYRFAKSVTKLSIIASPKFVCLGDRDCGPYSSLLILNGQLKKWLVF
jgi:hypothetical protein